MEKSFEFAKHIVGYIVCEEIDQDKMKEILSAIEQRLKVITPIRFYLEDESDEGISFGGLFEAIEFHFSHSQELEKIAIVSDDTFFVRSMGMKNFLVPAKIKSFERKERVKALNWIME